MSLSLSFRSATIDDAHLITNLVNTAYEYELQWKKQLRTNIGEVVGVLKSKDLFFLLINDEVLEDIHTNVVGCIR